MDSFHSWKGEASGGTIETMFAMGDLNLGKEIRDPFLLNPDGSYTNEQKKLLRCLLDHYLFCINIYLLNLQLLLINLGLSYPTFSQL